MFTFKGEFGPLCCSVVCALLVAGGVCGLGEDMGTHRLPLHVVSIVAAAALGHTAKSSGGVLGRLGLDNLGGARWVWLLFAAGALSGLLRYQLYRTTGLGSGQLYEQEFVPFLKRGSSAELILTWAGFLCGCYAAVLVPGILFFGVIQEPLGRAGWLAAGLFLQAAVFGWTHCFMSGTFDLVYGIEAFSGAILSGIAFAYCKNVYVPAVFMASSVFVATALLAAASP